MFSILRRGWLWLLAMLAFSMPTLAFADTSIHLSKYLTPAIVIVVICILAGFFMWAIRYWSTDLAKVWATLPRLLTFIVIFIAVLAIIIVLAGLGGVHIF